MVQVGEKFQGDSCPLLPAPMVEVVLSQCENFADKDWSIFRDLCGRLLWTAFYVESDTTLPPFQIYAISCVALALYRGDGRRQLVNRLSVIRECNE